MGCVQPVRYACGMVKPITHEFISLGPVADRWWVNLLRGIAGMLLAGFAFLSPNTTLLALVLVFGAYAIVDGVGALILGAVGVRSGVGFGSLILLGICGVLAGFVAWFWPGITALFLLFTVAAWCVVRGVFDVVAAVRLRKAIENEWLLGLAGVFSVLFGALLWWQPAVGLLTLTWLVGVYALVYGALMIGVGLRMRRVRGGEEWRYRRGVERGQEEEERGEFGEAGWH